MKFAMPMKEVIISRFFGKARITPTDMSGVLRDTLFPADGIEMIHVEHGSLTSDIIDGSICIKGHRLIIDVDIVRENKKCLIVNVVDTPG